MAHAHTNNSNNNMDVARTSCDNNEEDYANSNASDIEKTTAKFDELEEDFKGCKVRLPENMYIYIGGNIERLRLKIYNDPNEWESTTKEIECIHDYLKKGVDKQGDNNIDNNHNNSCDDDDHNTNENDDDDNNDNANDNIGIDPTKNENSTGNDSTDNANNDNNANNDVNYESKKKRETQNLF